MSWSALVEGEAPLLAVIGVVVSAWLGRLAGRAAMRQALTDERRQVFDSMHAFTQGLTQRLAAVEARLDHCEARTHEAEERANAAQRLCNTALDFLRRGMAWFADRYPGVQGLPVPDELKPHL